MTDNMVKRLYCEDCLRWWPKRLKCGANHDVTYDKRLIVHERDSKEPCEEFEYYE